MESPILMTFVRATRGCSVKKEKAKMVSHQSLRINNTIKR